MGLCHSGRVRFAASLLFMGFCVATLVDIYLRWSKAPGPGFRAVDANSQAWWVPAVGALAMAAVAATWLEDRSAWRLVLLCIAPLPIWAFGRAAVLRRRGLPVSRPQK